MRTWATAVLERGEGNLEGNTRDGSSKRKKASKSVLGRLASVGDETVSTSLL